MNTDVLEQELQPTPYPNNPSREAMPVPGIQGYDTPYFGSQYPSYPHQSLPYDINPYMDYSNRNQNYGSSYGSYDPYYFPMDKKDDGNSIMAEFLFSIAVIVTMILVSFLIYKLKLFLKRMKMLTPLMVRFLDAFETIFNKTANKIANKKIGKAFGTKVDSKGSETVNIVKEHLSEGLKEEFLVEPNKKEDKKIEPKVQTPIEEVEHLPSLDELENEINRKVK